jgi:hypothetical protein
MLRQFHARWHDELKITFVTAPTVYERLGVVSLPPLTIGWRIWWRGSDVSTTDAAFFFLSVGHSLVSFFAI